MTMPRVGFPEPADVGSNELRLSRPGIDLVGTSIGAIATAYTVAAHRTAVDMGRCSALLAAQETVLLTHCHSDHVAGLVAWLSAHTRRHQGTPTRVALPAERREAMLAALRIWPELDGVRRRVDLDEILIAIEPGDRVDLAGGAWAKAFAVHHSVPSLGWAIGDGRHSRPDLSFAGDGTVLPFEENPSLLDARVAVVDCSFLDDGTRVAARLGGHGHLQDWLQLYPSLTCDILVLSHLPAGASARKLQSRLEVLADDGPELVPWVAPP